MTEEDQWAEVLQAQKSDEVLEVVVEAYNKGGVVVRLIKHQSITGETSTPCVVCDVLWVQCDHLSLWVTSCSIVYV